MQYKAVCRNNVPSEITRTNLRKEKSRSFATMGLLLPLLAILCISYVRTIHSPSLHLSLSLTPRANSSSSPPSTTSSYTPSPTNLAPSSVVFLGSPPSTTPASATATSGHGATSNSTATSFGRPQISCCFAHQKHIMIFSRCVRM
jgi:hypothetical protein